MTKAEKINNDEKTSLFEWLDIINSTNIHLKKNYYEKINHTSCHNFCGNGISHFMSKGNGNTTAMG